MTNHPATNRARTNGLGFLNATQETNGSFYSQLSDSISPFLVQSTCLTNFVPALILSALNNLPKGSAQFVTTPLAKWMLAQKNSYWAFNYWGKDSGLRKTQPYPDDLDDTFCSLLALFGYDPELIDAECLAAATKILIAAEHKVGGPYRTWLVPKDSPPVWLDIDLAVNSNIAGFLRQVAKPLPNLTKLMDKAIASSEFHSPYYPNRYPIIYFISRGYDGQKQSTLISHILSLVQNGYWQTPLQTALAISALSRLGYGGNLDAAIQYLLDTQKPDGSWPAEGFCLNSHLNGHDLFVGAPALSTAFALEALELSRPKEAQTLVKVHSLDKASQNVMYQVISSAKDQFKTLKPDLQKSSIETLDKITATSDISEIILLPLNFARSLSGPIIQNDLLVNLGLANLYGWIAYTIYDDFLDDEGEAALLPVANVCMRYSLRSFGQALPGNRTFQQTVRHTFDIIDSANAWEIKNCRFESSHNRLKVGTIPKFGRLQHLAERSLGHGLSLCAILASTGANPQEIDRLNRSFRHYLIARQLRDDLHDWEQDIKAGQINYVAKTILQELKLKPGVYSLADLMPRLQNQFWHHSLTTVCKQIGRQTTQGNAFSRTEHLKQPNMLTTLFNKINVSLEDTYKQQSDAQKFLAALGKQG